MSSFGILGFTLILVFFPSCQARQFYRIPLPPGVVGPETIAFDCLGRGSYVGVSDGRILRWEGFPTLRWTTFATMPNWFEKCIGVNGTTLEPYCGRPLGLKFHPKTCELYVADAYHGLVVVPHGGGRGITVVSEVEGTPIKFTNALDINPKNGLIYFTDTSTRFNRLEFGKVIDSLDDTGRLMVYNPWERTTLVLLRGLKFANGVALSPNMDYLLVSETTTGEIHKFWLKGPRYHTKEVLLTLKGLPDNINRGPDGNFWIAQVQRSNDTSSDEYMPVKIDEKGHILEKLDAESGELVTRASDVKEFRGRLWIGSVLNPYVEVA